ncbi:hypothetical protein TNCV_1606691 [Trichonephila clavipes]|nr:hypothetical protein TNCV_1606691 [Trichonephila clavipes]
MKKLGRQKKTETKSKCLSRNDTRNTPTSTQWVVGRKVDNDIRRNTSKYRISRNMNGIMRNDSPFPVRHLFVRFSIDEMRIESVTVPSTSPTYRCACIGGHGHDLIVSMSLVRAAVPLKISRVNGMTHVKSVMAQSPLVGMVRKFGKGVHVF